MRQIETALLAGLLALALLAPAGAAAVPREFFGIVPQTILSERDVDFMRVGRIGTVRVPIGWQEVQPTRRGGYDWTGVDREIATVVRRGLKVLPFLSGTPGWLKRRPTMLPIDGPYARRQWVEFVQAAVARYGPWGSFWAERAPGRAGDKRLIRNPAPIRAWQIWNEPNFFYFAYPVSPYRYARLLKLTDRAIAAIDPTADILIGGLFGKPDPGGKLGMAAARFLHLMYRSPGTRRAFDGVALHPYAADARSLLHLTESMRWVMRHNGDTRTPLYITEMGWGSARNPEEVAFEVGWWPQARELRRSYRYLIRNRRRLNLRQVHWFTWKDSPAYCSFCDSVGLFRGGERYRAKPAWHALVRITGGRPRP